LAGDLAKNEIVARKVRNDQGWASFSRLEIGLREGEYDDIAR
jgi:hypothetical protein